MLGASKDIQLEDSLDSRKSEVICPVCGYAVEQSGKGRPRVYHEDCGKLEHLLGWVEGLLDGRRLTVEKRRKLRSRLWYLANCLNGKGRA